MKGWCNVAMLQRLEAQAKERYYISPTQNPIARETPAKHTICKNDSSPAPRGAPALKRPLLYTQTHYTGLLCTIPRYSTHHYSTARYTTLIAPHHNYNYNCNCNDITLITLHYITTRTPLHYTTTTTALHHTTSSSCGEVTAATIATTLRSTTPTTFRSISGFALPSVILNKPISPIGFLFHCAVLLVQIQKHGPLCCFGRR